MWGGGWLKLQFIDSSSSGYSLIAVGASSSEVPRLGLLGLQDLWTSLDLCVCACVLGSGGWVGQKSGSQWKVLIWLCKAAVEDSECKWPPCAFIEHPPLHLLRYSRTDMVDSGHESHLPGAQQILGHLWGDVKEGDQGEKSLGGWVSRNPSGSEKTTDWRQNGADFSALSWSSHGYFSRKGRSWCYTDKHMNKAKLIEEENFLLSEICAAWILAHGSTKSTSVFILTGVETVSHLIGGRWVLQSDVIA